MSYASDKRKAGTPRTSPSVSIRLGGPEQWVLVLYYEDHSGVDYMFGPFDSKAEAESAVDPLEVLDLSGAWSVIPLHKVDWLDPKAKPKEDTAVLTTENLHIGKETWGQSHYAPRALRYWMGNGMYRWEASANQKTVVLVVDDADLMLYSKPITNGVSLVDSECVTHAWEGPHGWRGDRHG